MKLANRLIAWQRTHGRHDLPWQNTRDPYRVWLSEIMLQQTQVSAVIEYYQRFLKHFPDVETLARAPSEAVMAQWAGLGYYSRARNLHKCAQIIVRDHNGHFPQDQKQLLKLPGIGDYTSAAIMTIAFNKPATVMDGNIERIISRIFQINEPLPAAKPLFKEKTALFFKDFSARPGDLAQAFMDIGATICTPKSPQCALCPLNQDCAAYRAGDIETYPLKTKKKPRPSKIGYIYWIEQNGHILLERRPKTGILAETLGFPVSNWNAPLTHLKHLQHIQETGQSVYHTFTHFDLELKLCTASTNKIQNNQQWTNLENKSLKGLPRLFDKVYKQFINTVE